MESHGRVSLASERNASPHIQIGARSSTADLLSHGAQHPWGPLVHRVRHQHGSGSHHQARGHSYPDIIEEDRGDPPLGQPEGLDPDSLSLSRERQHLGRSPQQA